MTSHRACSFFFNAQIDFFEEIAKYRAARRIWARELRETFGARSPRSWQMRFHSQTAGVSLTAQQPLNNIVRTTIEALAGVLGGTQSLHTNSYDEALALPTEEAVAVALRTQQMIAHESGVTSTVDPLGGSYFVEALTERMEARAMSTSPRSTRSAAWCRRSRRLSPARDRRDLLRAAAGDRCGERIVVGVNRYVQRDEEPIPTLRSTRRLNKSSSIACRACAPSATARRSSGRSPRCARTPPSRGAT